MSQGFGIVTPTVGSKAEWQIRAGDLPPHESSSKMVNTRSKTGALKNVPGSKKALTKSSDLTSTSSDTDEPKRKRRHAAKGESNLPSDKPPGRPEDGNLEALPMDIILEILSYLHPLDLLQLARTSRIFRNMLMSKNSRPIWRAARSALGIDVPECPPDQSEPQWARLIFDLSCPTCNTTDPTTVEWALRIRGCTACLKKDLIFGSHVHEAFHGIRNVTYILDLLPFAYQRMVSRQAQQTPPLSTNLADRQYYRPAIQPMANLCQSLRKEVSAKAPGAKAQLNTFVAERKKNALTILNAEGQLKSWEGAQARLRDQKIREEIQRWRALYREKLVALGHHQLDAGYASMETSDVMRLEDGWEKNRAFFEEAASRMKILRIVQARSPSFRTLWQTFLAQTDQQAPVCGLYPSSRDLLETDPQIKEILESADGESYQDELKDVFPTALDRWWESRKDILVEKIFDFKPQRSSAGEPGGSQSGPSQDTPLKGELAPSFASAYAGTSGPARQAILELAKSVFSCPCQPLGWLKNSPVYWDRSLTNHQCPRRGYTFHPPRTMDFLTMEFDALTSSQVDAVCAALGLDANQARFTELDELDARFRCANCPFKMRIMNWRVAIRHRHNKGKMSQRFLPTFAKIPDEEAAIVRAFELDHPDRKSPLGRIRSPLCDGVFQTTGKLLDYLKTNHNQSELAPDSYWIDPSVPPMPVLESDVFLDVFEE